MPSIIVWSLKWDESNMANTYCPPSHKVWDWSICNRRRDRLRLSCPCVSFCVGMESEVSLMSYEHIMALRTCNNQVYLLLNVIMDACLFSLPLILGWKLMKDWPFNINELNLAMHPHHMWHKLIVDGKLLVVNVLLTWHITLCAWLCLLDARLQCVLFG